MTKPEETAPEPKPPPRPPSAWYPRCPSCGYDLWDGIGRRWLKTCERCGWRTPDEAKA
jgi:hypothetical protein